MSEYGKYIVLEGTEATGKLHQASKLSAFNEKMLGRRSLYLLNDANGAMEPLQEPGGTKRANEIRRTLSDASQPLSPWQHVELLTEARAATWNETILPALDDGIDVITGTNYISTVTRLGEAAGLGQEAILNYTFEHAGPEYMSPDFIAVLALKKERARRGHMSNGYVRYAAQHALPVIDAGDHLTSHKRVFDRILDHTYKLLTR